MVDAHLCRPCPDSKKNGFDCGNLTSVSNGLDIKEEMALAPSPAFKSLGYIERMCDECTDDGRKEYISLLEGLVENVTVMHYLDWLTLVLASFVLALPVLPGNP